MSWREKSFERDRRKRQMDKNRWKKKFHKHQQPKDSENDVPWKDIKHPDIV